MTWGLALAFDTDDPEFARGVEAGIMWARLTETRKYEGTVSAANAEMVLRIAQATGRAFTAEPLADGWLAVTIEGPLLRLIDDDPA